MPDPISETALTMNDPNLNYDDDSLQSQLQSLQRTTSAIADSSKGNSVALLKILRTLEGLHRDIAEGLFQEALPENRQQLYHLLREIEADGGWPYIPRARLRSLLAKISQEI